MNAVISPLPESEISAGGRGETTAQSDVGRGHIERVFAVQQQRALELRTGSVAARIEKIQKLRDAIHQYRDEMYKACAADLKKPECEVDLAEILVVLSEANHTLKHLKKWVKPVKAPTPAQLFGTSAKVIYEPKGVCLIIAPWNYPINLTLGPLITAIAAGNTAIIKPSEIAPATAALLAKIIADCFDEKDVALFEGDVAVAQTLLELPFDHIFFTGSPAVGKSVMAAASKHLTSVTLELGGKSPVIIDESADLNRAAASIALGKFSNAGQTCIAPDYLFAHENVVDEFLQQLDDVLSQSFGLGEEERRASEDFARIVNPRHTARIKQLIDDAIERGATLHCGGTVSEEGSYISPTVLTNVPNDAAIMAEEIFGPVLLVKSFSHIDTAIAHINGKPKPLALYVFAKDKSVPAKVLEQTSSGDACVNSCLLHFMNNDLPFGGANNSGLGKAHGLYGFKAFSHERAVLTNHFANSSFLAPPYTDARKKLIKWLVRIFG